MLIHIFIFINHYCINILDCILLFHTGIRVNVPVDTLLLTLSANDLDSDASPITFQLESITFSHMNQVEDITANMTQCFSLDNTTGELRTAITMTPFSDGHFTLVVSAMNSPNKTFATVKVSYFNSVILLITLFIYCYIHVHCFTISSQYLYLTAVKCFLPAKTFLIKNCV